MDQEIRNKLRNVVTQCRKLLETIRAIRSKADSASTRKRARLLLTQTRRWLTWKMQQKSKPEGKFSSTLAT